MKIQIYLLLIVLLVTACAPTPQATQDSVSTLSPDSPVTSPPEQPSSGTEVPMENPLSPKPGDESLTRSKAFIQEASLLIRESYPPQISVNIKGELPTPCHQLRADIGEPTADNQIHIEVYSLVNPDMMCTQVTNPFEENIDLGTFPTGHYSVFVNEEPAGEFDS